MTFSDGITDADRSFISFIADEDESPEAQMAREEMQLLGISFDAGADVLPWDAIVPLERARTIGHMASLDLIKPRESSPWYEINAAHDVFDDVVLRGGQMNAATLRNGLRLALHRERLLMQDKAVSAWEIATAKEVSGAEVRNWLQQQVDAGYLFTAKHGGVEYVPGFLLNDSLQPVAQQNDELARVIYLATEVGEGGSNGWGIWTRLVDSADGGPSNIDYLLSDDADDRQRIVDMIEGRYAPVIEHARWMAGQSAEQV